MSESSHHAARRRVVEGQPRPPPNGHVSSRTWRLPLSRRQKTRPISPPKGAGCYPASRGLTSRGAGRAPIATSINVTYRQTPLPHIGQVAVHSSVCTERSLGLSSPQRGYVGLQNRVGRSYMARGRQLYTLLARPTGSIRAAISAVIRLGTISARSSF
jgi:hypothetical protein